MTSIPQSPYGAIYCIQNANSGRAYIGLTTQEPRNRWRWHRHELRHGTHTNPHLQRAWNKYGESAFDFAVLEYHDSAAALNEAECFYIDYLQSIGAALYNQKTGGGFGGKPSAETRQKLSKVHKGRKHAPGFGERVSAATRGIKKTYTPESYERLRNKQWAIGRKHTEEHKRKISEAGKGREVSEATRAKLSARRHTEETKKKMSAAQKGRVISEEARQKMRNAWQRRKERLNKERGLA